MAFGTALRTLGVAAFLGLNAKAVQADKPLTLDSNDVQIARSVTIYRDTYGVPHVFGPTDASCVFGYAYAQAEDNFWQVEDNYIRSIGRSSEPAEMLTPAPLTKS